MESISRLLATKTHVQEASGYFPNSFSAKFTILHKKRGYEASARTNTYSRADPEPMAAADRSILGIFAT